MLLLLLPLCWTLLVTGQGQAPPSPCPDVFRYVYDRGQWSGRVLVPVPTGAKRMVVVASLIVVDVELPTEHPGQLRLVDDVATVVQQVQTRKAKTVDYLLEFPTQSPLPIVDKIKVNRQVICQGPPVRSKIRTKVTFTHRLNGLLPPSSRPNQLPDLREGHNLDMVDEGRQTPPKNGGLELMDNEVVEVEAQEAELMSKPKEQDQDLNFGPDSSANDEDKLHPDDDAELLDSEIPVANNPDVLDTPKPPDTEDEPENEFDLDDIINDDVELLDNEIPEANYPDVQFKPKYPNGGKDREEIPENEFEFADDVELLDNEIPGEQNKPKHKDRGNNNNRDREDVPESEFDLDDDDFELMDNEILEADSPEVQNIPAHKSQGSNFHAGFVSTKGKKANPKNEYDSDDAEVLNNEVLQGDSIEVLNIPNHKSIGSNFKKGLYVPMNEADLTENTKYGGGIELLDEDNNMVLESDLEYEDNFSDNDLP